MNGCNGLVVVAMTVKIGHPHAAEADSGNGEAAATQLTRFHEFSPLPRPEAYRGSAANFEERFGSPSNDRECGAA